MEAVAGVEDVLLTVVQSYGHLALLNVIYHLKLCGSHVGTAAGEEVGQAHDNCAVIYVLWIVETGGKALKMSRCFVFSSFVLFRDFVAHC